MIKKICIFPGSFSYFHSGHKNIVKLSKKILHNDIVLEISIINSDKGLIDYIDVRDRINNIKKYKFILTKFPSFNDKINFIHNILKYNEIVFIVGSDTWERIWNTKYVGIPLDIMEKHWYNLGVRFLVFNRVGSNIDCGHGESLRIKDNRADSFNMNISSSEIRKNNKL